MAAFATIASTLTAARPFALLKEASGPATAVFPDEPQSAPGAESATLSLLEEEPSLAERLGRGEHVIIDVGPAAMLSRKSGESQYPQYVIFPVVHRPELTVLLCVGTDQGQELAPREFEVLHLLCNLAGPLVTRMSQMEELTRKAGAYDRLERRAVRLEQTIDGLTASRHQTRAIDHQMKSLLLANVVHELRTPLVAIRGYTNMLLEGRAGEVNGTQREYLSIVADNIDRLVSLTANLARLTGREQLRTEPLDLCALVRDCMAGITTPAAEKSIQITSTIPDEPFEIYGDRNKLGQVLTSLLMNALQYTEHGGRISIEVGRGKREDASIRVSDTGPGIPKELVDKLFSYGRLAPHMQVPKGIAAGLSLVHDIISLHGGRISVHSRAGEGSTFSIMLPAIKLDPRRTTAL